MTDSSFESRLAIALDRYAERATADVVRPSVIAATAIDRAPQARTRRAAAWRNPGRLRLTLALGLLVLAFATMLAAAGGWRLSDPTPSPLSLHRLLVTAKHASGDTSWIIRPDRTIEATLHLGTTGQCPVLLDGGRQVTVRSGFRGLSLVPLDGSPRADLPGTSYAGGEFWSPDRANWTQFDASGTISVVPIGGGVRPVAHPFDVPGIFGAGWASDSRRIAVSRIDGDTLELLEIETATGQRRVIARLPAPANRDWLGVIAWSPDGSRIVVTAGSPAGDRIAIVEVATGLASLGGDGIVRPNVVWSPDSSRFAVATGAGFSIFGADGVVQVPFASASVHPLWSPDGTRVAWVDEQDLVLASMDGRSPIRRPLGRPSGTLLWSLDGSLLFAGFTATSETVVDRYDGGDLSGAQRVLTMPTPGAATPAIPCLEWMPGTVPTPIYGRADPSPTR